ncbi:MAG TPA: metal-dependent hydrolase [Candidatus Acidoferrales bacterium]|jgi:L-ascorbate metabolism protein UlaG (beta-lactamase superfamily)|nr:metal-dependent hydrolase [Candidatus Acidoferrales bacterium]
MLLTRGNKITWLGHATFRITTPSGKVVLIDPWVSANPACPPSLRNFERLDVMLITHGHSDHMSDAVALGKKFKPQIVGIYEMCLWLESKGLREETRPMSKGGTQRLDDIEVTMVDAKHSSGIEDDGKVVYAGEAAGYIVRLPGGLTMYHAGDTAVFGDMKLIAEMYEPELACLPIGDVFTMGPREAAKAIRLLNVRHVIPMHYGTFPMLTGSPATLLAITEDILGLEIHALKPGETLG